MKRVIITMIVTALFGTGILFAGGIKIGYVNSDKIFQEYEEVQNAQKAFNEEQTQWQQEYQQKKSEIENLQNEYDNLPSIVTEQRREEKLALIEKKKRELQQYAEQIFGEGGTAAQREAELLQPIIDKINQVIKEIAIEENYTIIFDTVSGNIVYGKPNLDITDKVMKRLKEEKPEE